jgi:tRNA pseudouridine55 synthase
MQQHISDGILIIDKPKGLTSHDVVDIIRELFKIKKVGHAGTLDPIATGLLVVLIGKATKKYNILANTDKQYLARLRLGISTETGDAFGRIVSTSKIQGLDKADIENVIMSFKGKIEQMPPMFSAVKYKGKSLYKWARKGIIVPRKKRNVTISDIHIIETSLPDIVFDVSCTKGTYIRQLCVDIGTKLGCGAHMTELRRVRVGDFHISQAVDISRLKSLARDELYDFLIASPKIVC